MGQVQSVSLCAEEPVIKSHVMFFASLLGLAQMRMYFSLLRRHQARYENAHNSFEEENGRGKSGDWPRNRERSRGLNKAGN